jgi:hypothetical protein
MQLPDRFPHPLPDGATAWTSPTWWPLMNVLAGLRNGTRTVLLGREVDLGEGDLVQIWPAARLVGIYTAAGQLHATRQLRR